jgi:hypothetical protein
MFSLSAEDLIGCVPAIEINKNLYLCMNYIFLCEGLKVKYS